MSPISDMPKDRALVLDNWFPTTRGVRVRRGRQVHAGGMGDGVVDSLMAYHGPTSVTSKLFAATGGKIYDITVAGNGTESVTGLSGNRWQYVNFTVSGGHYLWACNGADAPRHFDGSSWDTPSLTISNYSSDEIVNVNAHKNRLWFVFRDSTDAGYLATGAISGQVTVFPLGGLFTKGGHLVAMATWTRDGGDGEDDLAVFISSEGQVAVYAGTDPDEAETWALIGVFDLGAPIGYRCFTRVAGDLALINIDGILPLSEALQTDRGAAGRIALTARINSVMNEAAREYMSNFGWQLVPYARGTMVMLNVPLQEGQTQHQYVMNTETGAWCRFKNWNFNCLVVFRQELYGGGNDGLVWKCDQTGLDGIAPIDAVGQSAYSYYSKPGILKQWKALQPILTTDSSIRPSVGVSTDFKDNASLDTPGAGEQSDVLFDSAIFDEAVFPVEGRTVADWASVSGEGYCASVHFRARTGRESGLTVWTGGVWGQDVWSESISSNVAMELNGFNVLYEEGRVL